jgi:hypothetical protein
VKSVLITSMIMTVVQICAKTMEICDDGINSYSCSCNPGFTGENCSINIDDCSLNLCQNNGTCEDGVDGFTCSHPNSYVCSAGETCERRSFCSPEQDNCTNNGICNSASIELRQYWNLLWVPSRIHWFNMWVWNWRGYDYCDNCNCWWAINYFCYVDR